MIVRIWDVEDKRKQKTVIVVKSKERGARTKVTACGYSQDGSLIGGGKCYEQMLTRNAFVETFCHSMRRRGTPHVANQVKLCATEYDHRRSPH